MRWSLTYRCRNRSENCIGPSISAQAAATPCGKSHHLNDSMCFHSGSLALMKKLSSVTRTKANIKPMNPKRRYFGRTHEARGAVTERLVAIDPISLNSAQPRSDV